MNQEDIIRMAREAGFLQAYFAPELEAMLITRLERFAALVASAEREACAKECEGVNWYDRHEAAAAIRARGNT